jgi:hypothetical protein
MKFKKKTIVIEAEQWFPDKNIDCVKLGITINTLTGNCVKVHMIETLEGTMIVSPGDWIITGTNGEKYPCKPDIFEKIFEPVER